jgi:hypothetical protein
MTIYIIGGLLQEIKIICISSLIGAVQVAPLNLISFFNWAHAFKNLLLLVLCKKTWPSFDFMSELTQSLVVSISEVA